MMSLMFLALGVSKVMVLLQENDQLVDLVPEFWPIGGWKPWYVSVLSQKNAAPRGHTGSRVHHRLARLPRKTPHGLRSGIHLD
jgi:hypothetical protein